MEDDDQIAELKKLIEEEREQKRQQKRDWAARYEEEGKRKEVLAKHRAKPETLENRRVQQLEWRRANRELNNKAAREYKERVRIKKAGRPKSSACESCGSVMPLHYDHCHRTNAFRGWLCHNCNAALGHVNDDITVLQCLIAYLNKHAKDE